MSAGYGYIRTDLLRDRTDPHRFVTVDAWASESAWKAFRVASVEAFEDLDARCAELTTREIPLGRFEAVAPE